MARQGVALALLVSLAVLATAAVHAQPRQHSKYVARVLRIVDGRETAVAAAGVRPAAVPRAQRVAGRKLRKTARRRNATAAWVPLGNISRAIQKGGKKAQLLRTAKKVRVVLRAMGPWGREASLTGNNTCVPQAATAEVDRMTSHTRKARWNDLKVRARPWPASARLQNARRRELT
jgi:hypothetical protein